MIIFDARKPPKALPTPHPRFIAKPYQAKKIGFGFLHVYCNAQLLCIGRPKTFIHHAQKKSADTNRYIRIHLPSTMNIRPPKKQCAKLCVIKSEFIADLSRQSKRLCHCADAIYSHNISRPALHCKTQVPAIQGHKCEHHRTAPVDEHHNA